MALLTLINIRKNTMKNRYLGLVFGLALSSIAVVASAEDSSLVNFHPGQVVTAKALNHNFQLLQKSSESTSAYTVSVPSVAHQAVSLDEAIQTAVVKESALCGSAQPCYVVVKLHPGHYQYQGSLPQHIILQGVPGSVLSLTGDLNLSAQSQLYDLTLTSQQPVSVSVGGTMVELHNVLFSSKVEFSPGEFHPFMSSVRQANQDHTVRLLKTVN